MAGYLAIIIEYFNLLNTWQLSLWQIGNVTSPIRLSWIVLWGMPTRILNCLIGSFPSRKAGFSCTNSTQPYIGSEKYICFFYMKGKLFFTSRKKENTCIRLSWQICLWREKNKVQLSLFIHTAWSLCCLNSILILAAVCIKTILWWALDAELVTDL